MSLTPLVSIIVVNYNGKRFLNPLLSSIFANDYSNFEIILVDNASTDDSIASIQPRFAKDKRLRLLSSSKNTGPAGGLAFGAQHAHGKYLVILGYDVEVDQKWLSSYVEFMESHPEVGIAQGKLLRSDERDRFMYAGDFLGPMGFLIERARGAKDEGQFDTVSEIFSINSATMIIPRALYEQVGGFDPDYFMYLEECDLCFRVHLYGKKVVFFPDSKVWHNFSVQTKSKKDFQADLRNFLGCRNYILTMETNLGLRNLLRILPLHFACWTGIALLLLCKGKFRHSLIVWKGILWHLTHLPTIVRKRNHVQHHIRKVSDADFNHVFSKETLSYYLRKAQDYTLAEQPAA